MNTRKQVLLMSALLLIMLVTIGIYAAWYPNRAEHAAEHFDELTAERGAILFARNCRTCHGNLAEGGALSGRLTAAPALNRGDLQGFADSGQKLASAVDASATELQVSDTTKFKGGSVILIDEERMTVTGVNGRTLKVSRAAGHSHAAGHAVDAIVQLQDPAVLADKQKLITNTISCGRVGTAMPTWALTQGGPLSDEQIRQLMLLITQARWDLVEEENAREDVFATKTNIKGEAVDWARLTEPMSEDTISMRVNDVSVFTQGDAIEIGDERLRLTAVPTLPKDKDNKLPKDKSGIIQVERGILGTTPLEHSPEETIYRYSGAVIEPAIVQATCGQTPRAPVVAGNPELIEPFEGQTVQITSQNVQFNTSTISVRTGGQVRLRLDNRDVDIDHNIAVYRSATDPTPAATGSVGTTFKAWP